MKTNTVLLISSLLVFSSCTMTDNQKDTTQESTQPTSQIEVAPDVAPQEFSGSIPLNSKE